MNSLNKLLIITSSIVFLTGAITIDDSIVAAHNNSDEIAIAKLQLSLKKSDFAASIQKFLPSVNYSTQRGKATLKTDGKSSFLSTGTTKYDTKNDVFEISEDLSVHKIIADNVRSWQDMKSEKAKLASFVNEMTVLVVQKHLDIIIANESLNLMEMIAESEKINISTAEKKKIYESISVNEYLGFESKYDDAQSRLIQAKMALTELKDSYKTITSLEPENLLMPIKFPLPMKDLHSYMSNVMNSNNDIESQVAKINALSAAKFASYANIFLPEVKLVHQNTKTIMGYLPGAPQMNITQSFVSANFPIYNRGDNIKLAVDASISSRIENRQMRLLRSQIETNAKQYWSNHHSFLLLERAKKKDLQIQDANLRNVEMRYQKNSVSNIDLLRARVDFYNSKINYLNTYREFVLNYYRLLGLL